MKITLLCNAYPPEFLGGTELVVRAQAQEFQRAGHDVRVICGGSSRGAGLQPYRDVQEGIEVLRIPKTAVESTTAHWQFARIIRLVEEVLRPDEVVHVHHWAGLSGDLVRRIARRLPVVVTLHDSFVSCPRFFRVPLEGCECPRQRPTAQCVVCIAPLIGERSPTDVLQRLTERWKNFRAELQAADRVVSPSQQLVGALGVQMDLESADWAVIPHGLCQDLRRPAGSVREDDVLSVLSFGNRSQLKGTLDLVRAMAALPPGRARLILAGAEVEAGFDDALRQAAGDLDLELHPAYDARALMDHAARADLAAFPSRASESYGLVIEEALAMGLPVWVSDRGALPEVLTDAAGPNALPGAVLPACDPEAWTAAFQRILSSPEKLLDARHSVPVSLRKASDAAGRLLQIYAEVQARQPASRR